MLQKLIWPNTYFSPFFSFSVWQSCFLCCPHVSFIACGTVGPVSQQGLWSPVMAVDHQMFEISLFCLLFRTDALLLKLSLVVGQQVFYGALWGSVLVSPLVRLPASVFIVTHFDRMVSLRQQTHMLGHDHRLVVSSTSTFPILWWCFWHHPFFSLLYCFNF